MCRNATCTNENWLSYRRSRIQLPRTSPNEKQFQREEAFVRVTVALTRAQRFCFIMCPLDVKGIIGAATVVGCLQHGAVQEYVTNNSLVALFLWNSKLEPEPKRENDDFLTTFQHSATIQTGEFRPAALVEIYHEPPFHRGLVSSTKDCYQN